MGIVSEFVATTSRSLNENSLKRARITIGNTERVSESFGERMLWQAETKTSEIDCGIDARCRHGQSLRNHMHLCIG